MGEHAGLHKLNKKPSDIRTIDHDQEQNKESETNMAKPRGHKIVNDNNK